MSLYFWLGAEAEPRRITIQEIQKATADHFNVPLLDMRARYGGMASVRPRQVAMYLAREITGQSYPNIGARFGGRDHTTVMNAVKRMRASLANNDDLLSDAMQIRAKLA